MNDKSSYDLIHMGLCIRLLANVSPNDSKVFVASHIEKLRTELEDANFNVSIVGMHEIDDIYREIKKSSPDEKIGTDTSKKLTNSMSVFEKIVYAESSTKKSM